MVEDMPIYHKRGKIVSDMRSIRSFRTLADVEHEVAIHAAFQMNHPEGKNFWLVTLSDEDNGFYVTSWIDGEYSGTCIAEWHPSVPDGLPLAVGFCYGYAKAWQEDR